MSTTFDNLFIFEMANNHQGDVEHGKAIIDAMADVAKHNNIRAAVKFQFRNLDTFIHPAYRQREDVKHIGRFLSTRLTDKDFSELVSRTEEKGLIPMATPFDEESIDLCLDLGIQIVKVASCSATDWPLLEEVSKVDLPIVVSTGGLRVKDIDNLVSFLTHRNKDFALMHCIGLYPTPDENLQLNTIEQFMKRYPGIPIGYSGHEPPENLTAVTVAVSKGARLLERHVGVETHDITLNKYSMTPEQTDTWVKATLRARSTCGGNEKQFSQEEDESLQSLQRGVYASREIPKGKTLERSDVYFAMPLQEGQLTSGRFGSYRRTYTASKDYAKDDSVHEAYTADPINEMREVIHEAKGMLNEAGITLGKDFDVELSHHFGMSRFREIGAVIINMINREYCKKLIVMLPNQKHPKHSHKLKEETFEILWGDLEAHIDDQIIQMKPGDRLLVKRNSWHSFETKGGVIFEEISTTHYRGDSYYSDKEIDVLDPMQRKTVIESW